MNEQSRRSIAGAILPVLALAITLLAILDADSLPDPMASHWDLSGDPNGSMGRTTFFGLFFALVFVTGLTSLWTSRRRDVRTGDLTPPVALATFMQWTFVGVVVAATIANRDAASWQDARQLSLPVALLIPAGAAVVAATAGSLVHAVGEASPSGATALPTVERVDGERLVWLNHISVRWPLILGGAMALLGTEIVLSVSPTIGTLVLISAAVVSMFAWLQVSADQRGLIVRYGPFRWPRTHIDLGRIESATVIDVAPLRHGGWGYRGSIRLCGRAAVVVRSGEGLQLDLRDGKRFIVTIDDAATAAGTINDLIRS